MKQVLPVALTLTLAACAGPEPRSQQQLAHELGVESTSVVAQYECRHAIAARNAQSAPWIDSMCIRMKDRMVFGQYDRSANRYVQSALVPFSTIKAAKHFTGMAHHVQLETDSGVHAFFVKRNGVMTVNDDARTDQEFAALGAAGLRTAQATYGIKNQQSSSFVPIFIPSR
jgi:hypothetical protein